MVGGGCAGLDGNEAFDGSFFLNNLPKSFFEGGSDDFVDVEPGEVGFEGNSTTVASSAFGGALIDARRKSGTISSTSSQEYCPHTSIGSRIASPITSKPLLKNLATLASVPASVIVFVIMLCAWRLYRGTIRRPLIVDADEIEEIEPLLAEYVDPVSERFDLADRVRCKGTPVSPVSASVSLEAFTSAERRAARSFRLAFGTSWTCKFKGWFIFDGGGRTMMNV